MPPSPVPITLYYVALFGALGLYLPYLSVYLTSVGLSEATATRVAAVGPVVNLFVPPLLGLLADARSARVWLLRGFSAAAALTFAGLWLAADNLVAIVVVMALFAVTRAPLVPLADATAHEHVRHHGGSYGRLRTWGSLGYLVVAKLGGTLYAETSIGAMVGATTAALALSVVFAWQMPAAVPRRDTASFAAWRDLLRERRLWLFLVAVAAGQMAGSSYDAALALHLRRLGEGEDFVGTVIAVGVAVETALIAVSGRLLAWLSAERGLALAFAAAALRWGLLAFATSRVMIVAQAPLHALTFGLYWVSATTLMREYAGPRLAAAGQGLLGAATAVGSIVGLWNAGQLLERGGGRLLFGVSAGVAALAAALATAHAIAFRQRAPLPHGGGDGPDA